MKMLVNSKEIDVESLSAYIPALLAELRSEANWSLNQTKLFVYILTRFYKHKVLIPKESYNKEEVEQINLEHVDRRFSIDKDTIIELTGIPRSQFSREIRKITHGLKASVATIPSKLDGNIKSSYIHRSWFEEFEYVDNQGYINIEIDKKVFPYLIVFCSYTRIHLSYVLNFKNNYSFDTYIMLKMKLNRYTKSSSLSLSVEEFKERLGIKNSYSTNFAMFKKAVLEKVETEINKNTDLVLKIENIKTGKKVTNLLFNFSLNPEQDVNSSVPIGYDDTNLNVNNNERNSSHTYSVATTLCSYGISIKNAEILVNDYGSKAVLNSINSLLSEINKGKDIKNVSGYLLGIIKNTPLHSLSSEEITFKQSEARQIRDKEVAMYEENWLSIETHLQTIQTKIDNLYQILKSGGLIYEQSGIETQETLKMIIEMNPDLLDSKRPLLGVYVDAGKLAINMALLSGLAFDIKIAEPLQRLSYLKKAVQQKTKEILEAKDPLDKNILDSEIKELKDLIVSLI
jgi:plasmid replication initiation protein